MRKIISLFQRNHDSDYLVRNEIVPGAEWVVAGEGIATKKYDGTCCMIKNGVLYKRYEAKKDKTPPFGFIPAQEPDPVTGLRPGWLEVGGVLRPEDKWHLEAIRDKRFTDGTYELCGPHINGNPEHFTEDVLVPHGAVELPYAPRIFDLLYAYFMTRDLEGIVWHHPDGRMVKIKGKDFGIKRKKE